MSANDPASPTWPTYARQVIEYVARGKDPSRAPCPCAPAQDHSGVFVTLHKLGRLRGCMGTLDHRLAVGDAVQHAAVCAASQDPRFPPVAPHEVPELDVEVSILSAPTPMGTLDDLELGRHGIIVQHGRRRGLFLPQVAIQHRFDKETFLSRCCSEKAGLPPGAWRGDQTTVLLFTTDVQQG